MSEEAAVRHLDSSSKEILRLIDDKETVVEIVTAVVEGLNNTRNKVGGVNLHMLPEEDNRTVEYIQFWLR